MLFSIQKQRFTVYGSRFTIFMLFTIHCSLFSFLSGCGNSITGSNTDLNVAHVGGKDCTQSGCHAGVGAAGTVFTNMSSGTPASGITVKAQSISTGAVITLGTSDSLGNFHYVEALKGYYNMSVGSKPWGSAHNMPEYAGCNRCHKASPAGGATGKLN